MDTLDLRQSVLDYIKNKADNKFLHLVKAMANAYQEEDAERDTIEQYNADIDKGIEEIENGKFYTQEEARKIANQ